MHTHGEPTIVSDPDYVSGAPRILGTRIPVWAVMPLYSNDDMTAQEIDEYFELTPGCAQAAIDYGIEHDIKGI